MISSDWNHKEKGIDSVRVDGLFDSKRSSFSIQLCNCGEDREANSPGEKSESSASSVSHMTINFFLKYIQAISYIYMKRTSLKWFLSNRSYKCYSSQYVIEKPNIRNSHQFVNENNILSTKNRWFRITVYECENAVLSAKKQMASHLFA